jgi:GNAT superfamily N-acetyltransferase
MGMTTYRTKDGREITFQVIENDPTDRGIKEPWVVHRIDALVDGVVCGYLKIAFIPRAKFDAHYTTIWHYMSQRGWCFKGENGPRDLDDAWRTAAQYRAVWPNDTPPPDRDAQLRKWAKDYVADFRKHEAFHVDKPLVDYIKVHDQYRRNGIGLALYKYGARWVAKEKGMPLYGSGLQTDEAKSVWAKMQQPGQDVPIREEMGPHDKMRRLIDYRM